MVTRQKEVITIGTQLTGHDERFQLVAYFSLQVLTVPVVIVGPNLSAIPRIILIVMAKSTGSRSLKQGMHLLQTVFMYSYI
jgi:hypothetical protein